MRSSATSKPGQFAMERFRERRRAFERRTWWAYPVALAALFGSIGLLSLLLAKTDWYRGFYWGVASGCAFTFVLLARDLLPEHIDRWRRGAEAERWTARELRPLLGKGWRLVNDIDTGRGNIDHVLIGPPGVFLLETKRPGGRVSISGDILSVQWLEDPDDGYENTAIGRTARGCAARLHEQLEQLTPARVPWVQPVVVLWAKFAAECVEERGVLWVHGKRLRETLAARSTRRMLPPEAIERLAEVISSGELAAAARSAPSPTRKASDQAPARP